MFGKATIGIEGDRPYPSLITLNIALTWVGDIVRVLMQGALFLKQLSISDRSILILKMRAIHREMRESI